MGLLVGLFLLGIVFQIVLCIVCINLAKEKGYEPILGFLLGFFAGIVGVIILMILSPNETASNRRTYHNNQYAHRHKAYHSGSVGHSAPAGRTRSGYKPVGKPKKDPFNQPNPPMQAIPKTQESTQVACPHCNTVLTVSQPGEYTCPNCQQLFIY